MSAEHFSQQAASPCCMTECAFYLHVEGQQKQTALCLEHDELCCVLKLLTVLALGCLDKFTWSLDKHLLLLALIFFFLKLDQSEGSGLKASQEVILSLFFQTIEQLQ